MKRKRLLDSGKSFIYVISSKLRASLDAKVYKLTIIIIARTVGNIPLGSFNDINVITHGYQSNSNDVIRG